MASIGLRHVESAARILLICPDCGETNSEFADRLRGLNMFYCTGDGCDYIFDLAPGRRTDFGKGFVEACKRFYAAFYTMQGQRARR